MSDKYKHCEGWSRRVCSGCGDSFGADQMWKNRCLICWKIENNHSITQGDKSFLVLQRYIKTLEAENAALRVELVSKGMDRSSSRSKKMKIPKSVGRALLRFCHPDHNGNSEKSTEITRWVMEHMEK
jgi:hypothetical protein